MNKQIEPMDRSPEMADDQIDYEMAMVRASERQAAAMERIDMHLENLNGLIETRLTNIATSLERIVQAQFPELIVHVQRTAQAQEKLAGHFESKAQKSEAALKADDILAERQLRQAKERYG